MSEPEIYAYKRIVSGPDNYYRYIVICNGQGFLWGGHQGQLLSSGSLSRARFEIDNSSWVQIPLLELLIVCGLTKEKIIKIYTYTMEARE